MEAILHFQEDVGVLETSDKKGPLYGIPISLKEQYSLKVMLKVFYR